ncbi:hypothetical protein [Sporisorium scitamineum]|uniref:Uncharacterized protein n=1 Tax=Sporisorium scitamineum TaxID=49012 RepID=A0A0F7S177_9BASI|nr:hypothetical protein [Sporisorium scitamineum]
MGAHCARPNSAIGRNKTRVYLDHITTKLAASHEW